MRTRNARRRYRHNQRRRRCNGRQRVNLHVPTRRGTNKYPRRSSRRAGRIQTNRCTHRHPRQRYTRQHNRGRCRHRDNNRVTRHSRQNRRRRRRPQHKQHEGTNTTTGRPQHNNKLRRLHRTNANKGRRVKVRQSTKRCQARRQPVRRHSNHGTRRHRRRNHAPTVCNTYPRVNAFRQARRRSTLLELRYVPAVVRLLSLLAIYRRSVRKQYNSLQLSNRRAT